MRSFRQIVLGIFLAAVCLAGNTTAALAQQKPFLDEYLAGQTIRFEEKLRKDVVGAIPGFDAARKEAEAQLNKNEARKALNPAISALLANSNDPTGWMLTSRAAQNITETKDDGEKYRLQEMAVTAAYGAFERSKTPAAKSAALALLGSANRNRESWRASLNAYKASLDLADNAITRAVYDDLREKYGFKINDYKVDSDAAAPKVCFQFSESLSRGKTDFSSFVAVTANQGGTSVSTVDSQLCVNGLKHGERYGIVLRQGLPSDVDEALVKNADYDIYVRDRSAEVRFTGKNYVLPKTGQQGIPLVSVNASNVDLEIYRIGDRSLLPTIHSEDFLEQVSSSNATTIAQEKGQKIWTGSVSVKSDLNQDVITAFPVNDAVKAMKPGVYVMFARVSGTKPADDSEDSGSRATQWFVVSDIGLTTFTGDDGVHVLVRSLASAAPMAGVEIKLVARNNELLDTKTTDAEGYVHFDAGLARGKDGDAPALINAADSQGDYGFLDLTQTAFDLTDRGIKGRTAPGPLDVFAYTERGVYRSGETVYVTGLLRDAVGSAVSGLPLTFAIMRPDGVEFKKTIVQDQGLGGHVLSAQMLSNAPSGTWRVDIFADPKRPAIGSTTFLVEDYVPEQLDLALKSSADFIRNGEPATINVAAKYLYGAAGANLDVAGDFRISAADEIAVPALKGYSVGLTDEDFTPLTGDVNAATTDTKGNAEVVVALPSSDALRPLKADITVRVSESGGRAISRQVSVPIVPKGSLIGVKPLFEQGALTQGGTADFAVVLVDPSGKRIARQGVRWTLNKVNRHYQWFFKDGHWNYEGVKTNRAVANGTLDLSATDAGKISAAVELGAYRLDVVADGLAGAQTDVGFSVGWDGDRTANTPDVLDMRLDKASYGVGDTITVKLDPHFAVNATLVVVSDKLQQIERVNVAAAGGSASITVKPEWGAGAYIVALAHRALDTAAQRAPGRSIGVAWFAIENSAHTLKVALDPPKNMLPRGKLEIPLKLTGVSAGEEAFVTVSAVDVGILNLTHYQTPDASGFFYGQRQMGLELRDLYGYLIDGMQGTLGAIRSGGDAKLDQANSPPPIFEPLARFSGIVKVGEDGTAKISFDIPAFNGTVRVAAVAWSKGRVGQAESDVTIRDPIVLTGTLPRFLNLADQSRFHVAIDNVAAAEGDYVLDLDVHGPVSVPVEALHRTLHLGAGQKSALIIPVTAAGLGTVTFDLRITGKNIDLTQNLHVQVKPSTRAFVSRSVQTLLPGASLTLSNALTKDLLPGSGNVALSVAPAAAIDVPALLHALDRYPYGCTEQTVSRAMPLLYVNRLAAQETFGLDMQADDRVREALDRVMARESSNGTFGLWGVGGEDVWLDAFAMDFLTRAREKNFAVAQKGFDIGLDHLRNALVNASAVTPETASGLAYAAYVLARNGRPVMGDIRYLAETKLADFASPLAKGQLAGALALLGDKTRATTTFATALNALDAARDDGYSRPDYGSKLRDSVALLALLAESNAPRADIVRASAVVEKAQDAARYTSTQEQSWMVLAAQALSKDVDAAMLDVDGTAKKGGFARVLSAENLDEKSTVVTNKGANPLRVILSTTGIPLTPEAAAEQGFKVERTYYSTQGQVLDPLKIKQNDRFIVSLKITEKESRFGRLLLVDPLPAGLEIDNPNLVEGTLLPDADWLKREVEPVNSEYRDDRFVAAFERQADKIVVYSVAYVVRAVSPGKYVQPGALIEDMYRPDRFGRSGFGVIEISTAK